MQYLTPLNFHYRSNHNKRVLMAKGEASKQNKLKSILKVLVVEDEPINQMVTKGLLESKGYQVDIAATGQEAVALYQANAYTAILMDMGLPDIPGTEVTRQIRALEQSNGGHIPIIACTANGLTARAECLAAGMDDFSCKPFEIETLNSLLKIWIKKLN